MWLKPRALGFKPKRYLFNFIVPNAFLLRNFLFLIITHVACRIRELQKKTQIVWGLEGHWVPPLVVTNLSFLLKTVAGPGAGAEISTSPSANPGHPVPALASSKSQVSKSRALFPSHGPQSPHPLSGTPLGGALPPSPLRDPSGLPISSGLCTSRGSRHHGDASRSIPAGFQCGGGSGGSSGDGGRSCDPAWMP